jgi:hypothetical protein
MHRTLVLVVGVAVSLAAGRAASQDAVPGFPFKEGDKVTFNQVDQLKPFLPPEFWEHREYFFYERMEIEIGPTQRSYEGQPVYEKASQEHAGKSKIGKDHSLEGYVAGRPFENADIRCKGDPLAGAKVVWNFSKAWNGQGASAVWSYTYWDRGDQLPLYYKGDAKFVFLKHRIEDEYKESDGDVFKNEKRQRVEGIDVLEPYDAKGIKLLTYRYESSDASLDQSRADDTWVYVPDLRRVRRLSTSQRSDSVQGTDFTLDDLRSFNGIPPQYEWTCLDERKIIAPMNTKQLAYPYSDDYNFGPYGFSFANDRWELRDAWVINMDPRDDDHPYSKKVLYIDKVTYEPLYSFAYDRRGDLWKILWHNKRYSEDWDGQKQKDPSAPTGVWYPAWPGIEKPMDLRLVSDIIVNVQTGTGNRIEFWGAHGAPFDRRGEIRKYIDIAKLNKGK